VSALPIHAALQCGATGLRAGGIYLRSPLAGGCYEAELECVPMTRPHEYAQGHLFEQPCDAPVLVSLSQRNQILADLVRSLRAGVPGPICVLARLYGPDFNIKLPTDLLTADVLLVHDPMETLPTLLAAGCNNIVLIQQDIRADGTERGDNALSVTLLRPHPAGPVSQAFSAWAQDNPLMQALHGLRLETFGQAVAP
jgi:hypothetical protein